MRTATDGGASDAADAPTVVDTGTTLDSGDASDAPVDAGADAATD